jgi:indole-3-glycerol phosphate synthase
MNSFLQNIVKAKEADLSKAKMKYPWQAFSQQQTLPVRDFVSALQHHQPAIIAEIKRASPSQGLLRADFDLPAIAKSYAAHDAACLSVLTEEHFFLGAPGDLLLAKQSCSLPVLRKDFIIDSYQIHESRALGADCILLIVALLDDAQLQDFCQLAQELEMAVLVESHNLEELKRALKLPTPLMGINNRNLHSFVTDLQCSIDLNAHIPADKCVISESGIKTAQDIQRLQAHGIQRFLIGEHFMRAENVGQALERLVAQAK